MDFRQRARVTEEGAAESEEEIKTTAKRNTKQKNRKKESVFSRSAGHNSSFIFSFFKSETASNGVSLPQKIFTPFIRNHFDVRRAFFSVCRCWRPTESLFHPQIEKKNLFPLASMNGKILREVKY